MIARLALMLAALSLVPAAPERASAPIAVGYLPQDKDERGLWMQLDEIERRLRTSDFVVRDPALNLYVRGVLCRMVGDESCRGVRLYIVRTAEFNASMAPNGMMIVNTGMLLRMQDEAQLAAILGHEFTHFSHQHSLRNFRSLKLRANTLAWLSIVPVGSYGAAVMLSALRTGMLGAIFTFSRSMETEADAGSVPLMTAGGYDPDEAPRIWEQFRIEQDATAVARRRVSRKDAGGGLFATHPPSAERIVALRAAAASQMRAEGLSDGRAAYRAAIAPWWPQLIDDEIKLNDFGGTDFLIGILAQGGWTPDLLYARGELYRARGRPRDLTEAAGFYRDAIAGGAPAEAWRGLGLAMMRSGRPADADEGHRALKEYLTRKPDAPDRAMIEMLAGEGQ